MRTSEEEREGEQHAPRRARAAPHDHGRAALCAAVYALPRTVPSSTNYLPTLHLMASSSLGTRILAWTAGLGAVGGVVLAAAETRQQIPWGLWPAVRALRAPES